MTKNTKRAVDGEDDIITVVAGDTQHQRIVIVHEIATGHGHGTPAARVEEGATAKLTGRRPTTPFYDRHDRNEPTTPTPNQRQQRSLPRQSPRLLTPEQISSPISQHRLRRTPRFSASPSPQPHLESKAEPQPLGRVTVTLGPRGQYIVADPEHKNRKSRPKPKRQLSQGNLSEDSGTTSTHSPSLQHLPNRSSLEPDRPKPHPAVRISKHTHSAILYALEETLRGPKKISDDPVELHAQMAELTGGGGPPTSNGNGNGSSSTRPLAQRTGVGSPSGIIGPRVIMQQRAAREARQREEKERLEREHAQAEARMQEEALRRETERQTATAAAGAGAGAGSSTAATAGNASRRPAQPTAGRANNDNSAPLAGPSRVQATAQAQPTQTSRHGRTISGAPQGVPGAATQTQNQAGDASAGIGRGRNSFPHAFERWETLSAHWEGLTSFWIRRLEQNSQEINQDAVSQQLSRQVTDLSSAGANLFHAVVELQRLRASSERKFQRWFFETRAELERSQEVAAMLEASLEEERRSRDDAVREALERDKGSSKIQKQLAEMRKELAISKEEARRAWEELGRREQEERDRTTSLQLGQPTIVGGVQVVPMTQGVTRGNSQRDPRAYVQPEVSEYVQSPTSRPVRPEYTPASAPVQPTATTATSNPVYQAPSAVHHQQSYGSEGTFSEGEYTIDAQGNFVRDSRGHKVPFRPPPSDHSDGGVDEFETPATHPGPSQATGTTTHQPHQQSQYSSGPDYTGTGFSATGWEEMQPRHHHPTRLSDVLEEEEERSRTSASRSQVSRG